ncbi:MAG: hypothetical protein QME58_13170 [Bacteroidota bacterium]|nr:hypothetical protein [Bacteroidota bacterium]
MSPSPVTSKFFIKSLTGLMKKTEIIFFKPYNRLTIPDLRDLFGIKSEKEIFSNELLNDIRKNKDTFDIISFNGVNAFVSKKFFTNYLALILERSAKNAVYKQLSIKKYTKFERDLYEAILQQAPISRKSMMFLFGLSGKKGRKLLDEALSNLWERLWITRVGFQTDEGVVWQAVVDWDKIAIRRALKIRREIAIKEIVLALIRSGKVITRPQIRRLLNGVATAEEVDKVITALLIKKSIEIHQSIIISGKKALISI